MTQKDLDFLKKYLNIIVGNCCISEIQADGIYDMMRLNCLDMSIDEEELDKLAEHWCPESGSYREGDIETQRVIRNAYKAGYRKAMED